MRPHYTSIISTVNFLLTFWTGWRNYIGFWVVSILFFMSRESSVCFKKLPDLLLKFDKVVHFHCESSFTFQPETLRMRALGRLKNLECLDGVNVTDEEMTTALKMAAASRPSSFSILAHARTDQSKPRTLSLVPTAQAILANSQNKPVTLMDDDSQWFQKVTS